MAEKNNPSEKSYKSEDFFVRKISKFAGERLDPEVPLKDRKRFKAGKYVKVIKIEKD
jgi:hypothetical protein